MLADGIQHRDMAEPDFGGRYVLSLVDLLVGFLFVFILVMVTLSISFRMTVEKRDETVLDLTDQKRLLAAELEETEIEKQKLMNERAYLEELNRRKGRQFDSAERSVIRLTALLRVQTERADKLAADLDKARLQLAEAENRGRLNAERAAKAKVDADVLIGLLRDRARVLQGIQDVTKKELETVRLRLSREQASRARSYAAIKTLLLEIKRQLLAQNVNVSVDVPSGVLRLPESLLFASGQSDLIPKGREALTKLAAILAKSIPCYVSDNGGFDRSTCNASSRAAIEAIYIEGHTDDVPVRAKRSRFKDNWELSAFRASNSYQALVNTEPILAQMRNSRAQVVFGLSAYADSRPVDTDITARGKNRRIDIRFLGTAVDPSTDIYPRTR